MTSDRTQVLVVTDALPEHAPEWLQGGPDGPDRPRICLVRDPAEAGRLLEREPFDVVVVDASRSNGKSLDLLRCARRLRPQCRLVLMDDMQLDERITQAFEVGVREYLRKPCTAEELLNSISRAMQCGEAPRRGVSVGTAIAANPLEPIRALICAVEAKDPYTRRHSDHVSLYAAAIARELGLPEQAIRSVAVAALVHDVGKIGVPDHILTKPGPLTEEEFATVMRHPVLGEGIVRNLSAFAAEAQLVRHHHENWDGGGYPDGLKGEQIPLGARIIRVADAMDAMLMRRSYKSPYPLEAMTAELLRCCGTEFDPRIAVRAAALCRRRADLLATIGEDDPPEAASPSLDCPAAGLSKSAATV